MNFCVACQEKDDLYGREGAEELTSIHTRKRFAFDLKMLTANGEGSGWGGEYEDGFPRATPDARCCRKSPQRQASKELV